MAKRGSNDKRLIFPASNGKELPKSAPMPSCPWLRVVGVVVVQPLLLGKGWRAGSGWKMKTVMSSSSVSV